MNYFKSILAIILILLSSFSYAGETVIVPFQSVLIEGKPVEDSEDIIVKVLCNEAGINSIEIKVHGNWTILKDNQLLELISYPANSIEVRYDVMAPNGKPNALVVSFSKLTLDPINGSSTKNATITLTKGADKAVISCK